MSPLNDPAARLIARQGAFGLGFLFALLDMRSISSPFRGLPGGGSLLARIGAEMLRLPCLRRRSRPHHLVEGGGQQFHIMHVGSAGDERQRDATPVD